MPKEFFPHYAVDATLRAERNGNKYEVPVRAIFRDDFTTLVIGAQKDGPGTPPNFPSDIKFSWQHNGATAYRAHGRCPRGEPFEMELLFKLPNFKVFHGTWSVASEQVVSVGANEERVTESVTWQLELVLLWLKDEGVMDA